MKRSSLFLILLLAISFTLTLAACGGNTQGSKGGDTKDSPSINAPAPDNNSANNPSSADTAFQTDSSGKRSDRQKGGPSVSR